MTKSILIGLTGVLIGCVTASTITVSNAASEPPADGEWSCYKIDDIADRNPHDNNRGYVDDLSEAMNAIAPKSPAGATQFLDFDAGSSIRKFIFAKN